jgi:acyl-coenzyme A thioesterase PaaI-like protein
MNAGFADRKLHTPNVRIVERLSASALWSEDEKSMSDAENLLDETEVKSFLFGLAFVREYSITVVSLVPGSVTIELPFNERFSGPPNLFPASMVGTAGDIAAVASCLTLMPKGWALATLDFTIKMTGIAKGEKLRAKGRVLQDGRTNSVGAADVYCVSGGAELLCGTVLATTRNFKIKT